MTVFISYRRTDTQQAAGRVADRLIERFGRDAVVIDVDTDQVGRDYRRLIFESIEDADVVLVLIGPRFFVEDSHGSRRLDNPDDPVRLELTRALSRRETPVIPVLVDDAEVPLLEDLPKDVQDLAFRGAVELAHHRFDRDYRFLEAQVARYLEPASQPAEPDSGPVEPPVDDGSPRTAAPRGAALDEAAERATTGRTADGEAGTGPDIAPLPPPEDVEGIDRADAPASPENTARHDPPTPLGVDASPGDVPPPTSTTAPSTQATLMNAGSTIPTAESGAASRRGLVLIALAAVVGAGVVGSVVALSAGGSDGPGDAVATERTSTSRIETTSSTVAPTTTPSTTAPPVIVVPPTDASTSTPPVITTPATEASTSTPAPGSDGPRTIIDTDANNELDDQYAIAYLLSSEQFDVAGVTVNRTRNGGGIEEHVAEAERIVKLVERADVPVLAGASGNYSEIVDQVGEESFDGQPAVEFIIRTVREHDDGDRVKVFAIGKLTNVALALTLAPDIADHMRVTWLGSNYPDSGREYNLEHDVRAVNLVLNSTVEFEVAVVRVSGDDGTAALTVTPEENAGNLSGVGPTVAPVIGRDDRPYTRFGDYAVALMDDATVPGEPRPLYDVGAIAVAINSTWADATMIGAPVLADDLTWTERPDNPRQITIRDHFDHDAIIEDFYATIASSDD